MVGLWPGGLQGDRLLQPPLPFGARPEHPLLSSLPLPLICSPALGRPCGPGAWSPCFLLVPGRCLGAGGTWRRWFSDGGSWASGPGGHSSAYEPRRVPKLQKRSIAPISWGVWLRIVPSSLTCYFRKIILGARKKPTQTSCVGSPVSPGSLQRTAASHGSLAGAAGSPCCLVPL